MVEIKALIDSDSKVNIITPTFTKKLNLVNQKINIKTQKIDSL